MKCVLILTLCGLGIGCGKPVSVASPSPETNQSDPVAQPPVATDGDSETADDKSRGVRPFPNDSDTDEPPHRCHRQRFAVCIGINNYADGSGYAKLDFAGNDAVRFAESLAGKCGFEHILLLTDGESKPSLEQKMSAFPTTHAVVDTDVTYFNIHRRVLAFLAKATAQDDLVLFFFSGHGDSPNQNVALLVTSDYHPTEHPENYIPVSAAFQYLDRFPIMAQNRLMILDTCRSGHAMDSTFTDTLDKQNIQSVILASCNREQSSFESPDLKHGRFTWALIGAIHKHVDTDNLVWVGDLSTYVYDQFKTNKWSHQSPRSKGQDPMFIPKGSFSEPKYFTLYCPVPAQAAEMSAEEVLDTLESGREAYIANRLEEALHGYSLCMPTVNALLQAAVAGDDSKLAGLKAAQERRKLEFAPRPWAGGVIAEFARVLYRLGRLEEASREIARAADFAPESLVLAEVRGYQELDAGRLAPAEQQFAKALAAEDPLVATPFLRASQGLTYYQMGRYPEAARQFNLAQIATKQPSHSLAYSRLKINSYINSGSPEEAVSALKGHRKLLISNGADPARDLRVATTQDVLAETLRASKRPEDAAKAEVESKRIRIKSLGKEKQLIGNAGTANDLVPNRSRQLMLKNLEIQ